jgi:hypothetical protein
MIEAELPDGTVLEFPAGTSPEVVQREVKRRLSVAEPIQQSQNPQETSWWQSAKNFASDTARQRLSDTRDVTAGLIRGAGSIGATVLAPADMLGDYNAGKGLTLESNRQRRQDITEGLRQMGANTESLPFQGGKIASEIAGTMGAGGVLSKALQAAKAAPAYVTDALKTAGFSSGGATGLKGIAARTAGGAAAGGAAAAMVDPEEAGTGAVIGGVLPLATQAAQLGYRTGRGLLGATTGAGDDSLRVAYESGKAGGPQAQTFRENMRGQADFSKVLDDARANLEAMRQSRSQAYRADMAAVRTDKTVLDMTPIEQSIQDSLNSFTFKGVPKNKKVLDALNEVKDEVAAWRQLDPAEYHTPEGLDALKQRIGELIENQPFEAKNVRLALKGVYDSTKRQIEAQAPIYSKTMKDYHDASEALDQITRTLSLGGRATDDTALRKLQSVMRNNANTNYGARAALVNTLGQEGGRDLMPALAGQSLNQVMPRGVQRATAPVASLGLGLTGNFPAAAGAAAASSPRLMGEAFYLTGKLDPLIEALRRGAHYGAPVVGAQ